MKEGEGGGKRHKKKKEKRAIRIGERKRERLGREEGWWGERN